MALKDNLGAFANFRALNDDCDVGEREQLFRSLAQLFSHVSERCDDEQVTQYDDILCVLADKVAEEARQHVAEQLSRLERAPGSVVVKLAHDSINVARPLLEFSNVLSDDDLIEIVNEAGEPHRVVIANRDHVGQRVGGAIVERGGRESVARLIRNKTAKLDNDALKLLVQRAQSDDELSQGMRARTDIDWEQLGREIDDVGRKVLSEIGLGALKQSSGTVGKISAVVYNRMRNSAGFNAGEWKVAWNQVKALADRRKLDKAALARFARFGYGHQAATGLTIMLRISPELFVKWLATQDYVAFSVAARALDLDGDLFESLLTVLPWRDFPHAHDVEGVRAKFDALGREEAAEIFNLWRSHSFRKRADAQPKATNAA